MTRNATTRPISSETHRDPGRHTHIRTHPFIFTSKASAGCGGHVICSGCSALYCCLCVLVLQLVLLDDCDGEDVEVTDTEMTTGLSLRAEFPHTAQDAETELAADRAVAWLADLASKPGVADDMAAWRTAIGNGHWYGCVYGCVESMEQLRSDCMFEPSSALMS